jgi:hypothetical protein
MSKQKSLTRFSVPLRLGPHFRNAYRIIHEFNFDAEAKPVENEPPRSKLRGISFLEKR